MVVKRGNVYHAKLEGNESIQGGHRPVLVISNEANNNNAPTLNVVPLTSKLKALHLPCHVLIKQTGELTSDSMALCEQTLTINKNQIVGKSMAELDNETMLKIENGIDKQFGKYKTADYEYIEMLKMDIRLSSNKIEKTILSSILTKYCKKYGLEYDYQTNLFSISKNKTKMKVAR